MTKASKKYKVEREAQMFPYYNTALTNDVTNGEVTKKPRFGKKPKTSKPSKIDSTKIDHPYETGD
jgi:hypothetical protein